jgi:uncharacterized protein
MRCPLCRREVTWEDNPWRPFCSERCQIIDLGNWASEGYRISDPAGDDSTDTVRSGANEESEFNERG